MSESRQFLALIGCVLLWASFVLFYRYGGWKKKVWRRWVGGMTFPLILSLLALWLGTFYPLMLASCLTIPFWLHLGYGATTTGAKVRRRFLYGLVGGMVMIPLTMVAWEIAITQVLLSVSLSLLYGIINSLSATGEEGTLGGGFVLTPVFTVLR